jgi:hypothetical protein
MQNNHQDQINHRADKRSYFAALAMIIKNWLHQAPFYFGCFAMLPMTIKEITPLFSLYPFFTFIIFIPSCSRALPRPLIKETRKS